MSSGIADVIDSMFCLVNNFKLFEDGKIDFERIMHKIVDLLRHIKKMLKVKGFEPDF